MCRHRAQAAGVQLPAEIGRRQFVGAGRLHQREAERLRLIQPAGDVCLKLMAQAPQLQAESSVRDRRAGGRQRQKREQKTP